MGVNIRLGDPCFLKGYEYCDAGCDNAVRLRPMALVLLTVTAPRYDFMFTDASDHSKIACLHQWDLPSGGELRERRSLLRL